MPTTKARLRPNRSPTLLLMRMNAADTSASMATADWTPLTVVSRSWTTAEIDTFMNDVSITNTNIAAARRMPCRGTPPALVAESTLSTAANVPLLAAFGRWATRYHGPHGVVVPLAGMLQSARHLRG